MKFYIVKNEEFSGWECDGHMQTYIVAANSREEVISLFPENENWETPLIIEEFVLPDLKRKKKAFIVV